MAKGPAGVATTRPLTLTAGVPLTVDVRNAIVTIPFKTISFDRLRGTAGKFYSYVRQRASC